MDLAYERSDWIPTADGQAILRNNRPLLAYIGGKAAAFTSKDHNFIRAKRVEKQLIVINNSRETVTADCRWSLELPQKPSLPGVQASVRRDGRAGAHSVELSLLPATLAPASVELSATVSFSNGEVQKDSFAIHVMPRRTAP